MNLHLHTGTATIGALLDGALLAAPPFTLLADDVLLQSQLTNGPLVEFFQGHAELVHDVLTPTFASPPPSPTEPARTEEHVEEVHGAREPTAPAPLLEGLLAILIVNLPLLGIGERFVGLQVAGSRFQCKQPEGTSCTLISGNERKM